MNPVTSFIRRNSIIIFTVASVSLLHYSWYHLQFNETFVPKDHKVKFMGLDLKKEAEAQAETKSA